MYLQKIPLFQQGTVLTQEMLITLRDIELQREQNDLLGYSDGILNGCSIVVNSDVISISPGAIIVKGNPYYVRNSVNVCVDKREEPVVLVARASEQERNLEFSTREIDFLLIPIEDKIFNDVELCRFILQNGASLRYKYRDFKDMDTEYDTVCIKNSKWAAFGRDSISFEILKQFEFDMKQKKSSNVLDQVFLLQIAGLNGRTLSRNAVCTYIAERLEQEYIEYDNEDIYKKLCDILLKTQQNDFANRQTRKMDNRRMIID